MIRRCIIKFHELAQEFPLQVKSLLKLFGLNKLLHLFWDKYNAELSFQTKWAKAYNNNNEALKKDLLELWDKNRCLKQINRICNIGSETKVLDVGCGIASVLNIIEGSRYGIDPLAEEYKKMYSYPEEIIILKGHGEKIPFSDQEFDVVFCSNVLDHVTCPEKVVAEINRVLKPKGYFNLIVEIFDYKTERNPAHPHCFIKSEVNALLSGMFDTIFDHEMIWPGGQGQTKGLIKVLRKI
jgi:ubiquinone/menaquinone biosynthesis C-methylase UbiE